MKKIILVLVILIVIGAAVAAWIFLGSATGFSASKEFLYIRSGAATREAVLDSLRTNKIITNESAFNWLAGQMNYWQKIRPGKYEVKKGSSLLTLVRKLRNGQQTPVNLVISKYRTKEDFARAVGNRFECDSSKMIRFLNSADSLAPFETDPEVAMWRLVPDTYTYLWNTSPAAIYEKLVRESNKFWSEERKAKASALGLTPLQVYILASIVEEETNYGEEKDTIASVYINRYKKGMMLGADPTVKFALRDFSIKWIHGAMLDAPSPYNTYRNKGLPPGPICTPSKKTLDEVLKAPQTDYFFFVASSKFDGTHRFSNTYAEHLKKADAYQEEDKRRREAKAKQNAAK